MRLSPPSPKTKATRKLYRQNHASEIKEYMKKWWESNKKRINANRRQSNRERTLLSKRKPASPRIQRVGKEKWAAVLIVRKRAACKKRHIVFSTTVEDLMPFPTHCPVLGMELSYFGKVGENYATIDRVIPSKGYVHGNVQIISMRANRLKNDATFEEIQSVLSYIARNTSSMHYSERQGEPRA